MIPHTVPIDAENIYAVFTSAADFFYNLRRSNKSNPLAPFITVQAFELEERYLDSNPDKYSRDPVWMPVGGDTPRDLNRAGVIQTKADGTTPYGFKVASTYPQPLYVWAFMFNMSDLSIGEFVFIGLAPHRI